jgi:hypothetical protein
LLSHYATSQKVAGSIPDEIIGFYNLPNPLALGSTHPLTEMSTRNLPWGKGWPAHKTDNLTAIGEPTVQKMWDPQCLTTLRASMACYKDTFTFFFLLLQIFKSELIEK